MTGDAPVREPSSVLDVKGDAQNGYHAGYNYLQHIPSSEPRRIIGRAPYTSRVVVYRPQDMRNFSGVTIMETIHPSDDGFLEVFNVINRFYASRGIAVVTINHPTSFDATQKSNPERYGSLDVKDWTQFWGTLQQLGQIIKNPRSSPLAAVTKRLYLTGYSFTGMCTSTFANFYHDETRLPSGAHIFDGYLPHCNEYYIQPMSAPVIRVNTQSDFDYATNNSYNPFARVPDADDPYNRTRRYEVSGSDHAPLPLAEAGDAVPPPRTTGGGIGRCMSTFPTGAQANPIPFLRPILEIAVVHMEEWLTKGTPPPHAPRIEIGPDIKKAKVDENGNAVGGLRMPDLQYPLATYGVGDDECRLAGYRIPFSVEKCRRLYGDMNHYLSLYDAACDHMVAARWMLPASSERLKNSMRSRIQEF